VLPAWTLAAYLENAPYRVPAGVRNVTVHVPEAFDPAPPLNVVVYFHGANSCAEHVARHGWVTCRDGGPSWYGEGHDARHDDAMKNSIFVVPQFAFLGGGSAGRLAEPGFALRFFDELLGHTLAPAVGPGRTLQDVASVTLVASSAGYLPAEAVVQRGEIEVRNIVLIDAIFAGDMDVWARWIAPGRKFVAIYGPWPSQIDNARALASRIRGRVQVAEDPGGDLSEAIRQNDVVFAPRSHDHYFMSHMTLTKAVAGLPIPARNGHAADVVTPVPAPPHVPRGAFIAGVLEEGDARLTSGAVFDEYAFGAPRGLAVQLTARGGQSRTECPGHPCPLDVRLELRDARGAVVARDDDSLAPYDASLTFTAPEDGTFIVRVTTSGSTWGSGYKSGPYSLTITEAHRSTRR
jgi:hypothetical protein